MEFEDDLYYDEEAVLTIQVIFIGPPERVREATILLNLCCFLNKDEKIFSIQINYL